MEHITILQRVAEMERERYQSSGDYSVTDIIDPPRLVRLSKRYKAEIIPPLKSVISSMFGTAVHEYFEKYLKKWRNRYEYPDYTFEEQVQAEICGRNLSGRYDIRDGTEINDIKTAKTGKKVFDHHHDIIPCRLGRQVDQIEPC